MNIAIIDDEKNIRDLYKSIILKYFPDCENILEASCTVTAIDVLKRERPDIVIIDIDLKDGTGFDVLQAVKPHNFSLIFATAYNEFAIKAIKFSALDYILKPIDESEFCSAIEKARSQREKIDTEKQLKNFFDHFDKPIQNKNIILKTAGEIHVIAVKDILYCRSDNSYTTFYLQNNEEIIVSKSIKEYEEMLSSFHFFRTHTSYLVNLAHVKKMDKAGGSLILKNGKEIPVSFRKKAKLIEMLENM